MLKRILILLCLVLLVGNVRAAEVGDRCVVNKGALIYQLYVEEGFSKRPIQNRMNLPTEVIGKLPKYTSERLNSHYYAKQFDAEWDGGYYGISTISDGWDNTTFVFLFQEKDILRCE